MSSINIPSLFKSKGPRQFDYKPRYYDELREDRDSRNKQIKREVNKTGDVDTELFRMRMRHRWEGSKTTNKANRHSTFRMLAIAIVLFALTYYILS